MNKEQEQFWKLISEPYDKECANCMYDRTQAYHTPDVYDLEVEEKRQCALCTTGDFDGWKWDKL